MALKLYTDVNHEFEAPLSYRDPYSGLWLPWEGVTTAVGFFTDVPGGAPLGGTTVPLEERGGEPGTYYGVMLRPILVITLGTLAEVYEVVDVPGSYRISRKWRVAYVNTTTSLPAPE